MSDSAHDKTLELLRGLIHDLVEALRSAENEEWHHAPKASERFQTYLRLGTWCSYISRRIDDLSSGKEA